MANIAVDFFIKGGPIMWPLVACLLASLAVMLERAAWWYSMRKAVNPDLQERIDQALTKGDFEEALKVSGESDNPYGRTLYRGLSNADTSMLGAMQLQATAELEKARARQWILSTFITMAPLLGLIGTVIGIMGSFNFVGNEELAATKVSGGIAEALIATATGLGIAILCLLPYNYFNKLIADLRVRLEQTINHLEIVVESAQKRGYDLRAFISERNK